MDNLDLMILDALGEKHEPDEYLVLRTVNAMRENKKQNVMAVDLIFILNILGIVLAGLISFLLPVSKELHYFFYLIILMWISAILPVYVIARQKLAGLRVMF